MRRKRGGGSTLGPLGPRRGLSRPRHNRRFIGTAAPFLSGVLLLLAYPPFNQGWIAWWALIPAIVAWRRRSGGPRRALVVSTLLGGLFWGAGLFYPLLTVEGAAPVERVAGFAILTIAMAACFSAFLLLYHWFFRRRSGVVTPFLTGAALWVALEYLMRRLAVGFSVYLGVTQWQNPALLHFSSFLGIHGVSAVLAAGNCLVARLVSAFFGRRREEAPPGSLAGTESSFYKGSAYVAVVAGITLVATLVGSGWRPFTAPDQNERRVVTGNAGGLTGGTATADITVVLVQPGFTPERYDAAAANYQDQRALLQEVIDLTKRAVAAAPRQGPLLIAWPETALHIPAMSYAGLRARVDSVAQEMRATLVAGFPRQAEVDATAGEEGMKPPADVRQRNSAFIIGPDGRRRGIYDKVYVIPIAEAQFAPGHTYPSFPVEGHGAARLGIGICSDAVEPTHALQAVRSGATSLHYLASLSQIGGLGDLETAFLAFRAAEHGMYVTQTATTGPTVVVGPTGRIVARSEGSGAEWVSARITPRDGAPTFYTRWGDIGVLLAGLYLLLVGLMRLVRGGRKRRSGLGPLAGIALSMPGASLWLCVALIAGIVGVTGGQVRAQESVNVWVAEHTEASQDVMERGNTAVKVQFAKENKGAVLTFSWVSWEDLYQRFMAAAAAGGGPDVVLVGEEALPLLVREGLIAPLDSLVDTWDAFDDFYPVGRRAAGWQGHTYGVPAYSVPHSMVYNEAPLVKVGIDHDALPRSWDDFKRLVAKVGTYDGEGINPDGTDPAWLLDWTSWLAFMWQSDGVLLGDDGEPVFQSKAGRRALTFMKELYDSVAKSRSPDPSRLAVGMDLAAGRAASAWVTPSYMRYAELYAPRTVSFLKVGPPLKDTRTSTMVRHDVWVIPADSEHKQLAWAAVKLMSEPRNGAAYSRSVNYLPSRQSAAGFVAEWPHPLYYTTFLEALAKYGKGVPKFREYGMLDALLQEAVRSVLTNIVPADKALEQAKESWRELVPR